jgi:hypothetical protein
MKKSLHNQFAMLGSNSRRWIVSSKNSILLLSLVAICVCFSSKVQAQEEISKERNERAATAVSGTAPSTVEQSALNPELKELGIKINLLLNQVRTQLADASNKQWFSENLQSSLSAKSAQVCPNIALIDLMLGTQSFIVTPEIEKQELLYVIDVLNVSINGMLTK